MVEKSSIFQKSENKKRKVLKILKSSKKPLTAKNVTAILLLNEKKINNIDDIDNKLPYKQRANEITKVSQYLRALVEEGSVKKIVKDPEKGAWKMSLYEVVRK